MADNPTRLLLVEDDSDVSCAVARSLRREGFEVTAALSCATARALTGQFDVGIFDIGLPDGDGVELASGLTADPCVGRAVFFSADSRASTLNRAAALGPVVRKQDGVEALLQVLLKLRGRETANS